MRRASIVALTALAACGHRGESKKHEEPAEAVEADRPHGDGGAGAPSTLHIDEEMLRDLRVTTAAAVARPAGERVTALGDLEVNQEAYAEIAAPMAARVVKVLAKPGDMVKVGQTLVVLHSPELGKARAEYQATRARADVAAKTLARKRELVADKLITGRELQEAEATSVSADADVKVALAALHAFGSIDDTGDVSTFALRAPVGGTVIDRAVVMGQLADPSRTLFRVGDLSTLWIVAHVSERDAVRVPVGGKASVTLAAMPGTTIDATVAMVGREVEKESRTVAVRLDVANPTGVLRPGMSATVLLPLGDATQTVVVVPLAAVQRVGDGWAVFLPRGKADFEIRKIGRGRDLGNEVEVMSGLVAGDTVVVDGAFLLKAEADKASGEGGDEDSP